MYESMSVGANFLDYKIHLLDPKDAPDGLGSLRAESLVFALSST